MGVQVVPYRDEWPLLFAEEADRLAAALTAWLVGPVEHVGSTSVPGLAAKPVLDLLAPVADLVASRAAVPVLAELGYRAAEHRPHEALWCYRQSGPDYHSRTHQLHLTRPDSALWQERVTFRDALRADAGLRSEYADLKAALADGRDLVEYTDGKREFVARVLSRAGLELG